MRLAIILAEYGRPAPDVTQYRDTWPEAEIQVFSGNDLPETPELDPAHPRYGWRMNDYWKVRKMLDSGSDTAMCFDSDMWIVDREAARTLPAIAYTFGLCLPINPRYTLMRDVVDGADVSAQISRSVGESMLWHGPSFNCSPIAINLHNAQAVQVAETYCRAILNRPARGPVEWHCAFACHGYNPLMLPPQWCVCSRHIGVGGEIMLHMGHADVARHYGNRRTS